MRAKARLAVRVATVVALLAIAKDAAVAVGSALVDVVAVAGKTSGAEVAAASVVIAVTLHEAAGIEMGSGGFSKGFADVEHLREGFGLGSLGDGASGSEGDDGQKNEDLGVHIA